MNSTLHLAATSPQSFGSFCTRNEDFSYVLRFYTVLLSHVILYFFLFQKAFHIE